MPPVPRTQMFCLLQNSFLVPLHASHLSSPLLWGSFPYWVGMTMVVSKTRVPVTGTCSWTWPETFQRSNCWKLACLCIDWIFHSWTGFHCGWFFLFSRFRSTLIQKVPLRCLSWSRRDWSTQTPIPICYPSSSTAYRCHVSTFTDCQRKGYWRTGWSFGVGTSSQIAGHTLPLSPIQNLTVADELGISHWLHPAEFLSPYLGQQFDLSALANEIKWLRHSS